LKRLRHCDFVVVALVITFSFLPFLQPRDSWNGFGSLGSHFYKNRLYEIYYSDNTSGVGKPEIYITNGHDSTPLIEFSDHTSWLDRFRLYPDFRSTVRVSGHRLEVTYSGDGITLTKIIEPSTEQVRVTYKASQEVNLSLALWRWYYEDISGVTKYDWKTSKIQPTNELEFSFQSSAALCRCKLFIQPRPEEISINGDSLGINKIVLVFRSSSVDLRIKADPSCHISSGISSSSLFVYPIIAGVLSVGFLGIQLLNYNVKMIGSLGRGLGTLCQRIFRNPLVLALVSSGIRLSLAPFFMHIWDVTTIHEALQEFLSGKNVYESVEEKTEILRIINGVEANYEGYAYLPHPLLLYAPFYLLYKLVTDGRSPILGGHFDEPFVLIQPNIYIFLMFIKIPIIITDGVITYLLAVRSFRAGLIYAFLPYSIFITSIWGNFDSLIGLFLLLTIMFINKRPLLAGLFFGTATMKIFVIIALPVLLLSLPKDSKSYTMFMIGFAISQIPTLLFMLQNPEAMLNVLLFHTSRSPGGVNIFNLAPKIYSYDLQSIVNKLALLMLGLSVLLITLKSKNNISETFTLPLAAYMVFGPVTNEQHLAALIPLLLFTGRYLPSLWLSNVYLAYALIYSGPTYFTRPLATVSGTLNNFLLEVEHSWNALFGGIIPQLLYFLALLNVFSIFLYIKRSI